MKKLLALSLLILGACQGPNPVRVASERANWKLMNRCADGWFKNLPFNAIDEKLVRDALKDWDEALAADEALVEIVVPSIPEPGGN